MMSARILKSTSNSILEVKKGDLILDQSVDETIVLCSIIVHRQASIRLPLNTQFSASMNIINGYYLINLLSNLNIEI